jgi:hypothetical protein
MGVYTTDQYTKLLLHCDGVSDGTSFIDSSGLGYNMTPIGDTRLSSIQKRYGTTSAIFNNNTTSGLTSPRLGCFDGFSANGSLTIDFWFYLNSSKFIYPFALFSLIRAIQTTEYFNGNGSIFSVGVAENQLTLLYVHEDYNKHIEVSLCSLGLRQWHHFAAVKIGSNVRIYLNGIGGETLRFAHFAYPTNSPDGMYLSIGKSQYFVDYYNFGWSTSYQFDYLNGFIDEFRLSLGVARWTTNFDPDTCYITASAGSNGIISPSGNISVAYDTSKIFTITPNATYAVSGVLVDGLSVGTPLSYTFGNVVTDHTISATFDNNIRVITASAGLNGSISPSGSVSITIGQSKTFTFTPDAGYEIEAVTVDGVSQGVINTYTFTNVQAAHTISVSFKLFNSYLITASASTGGTITPSGSVAAIKGSNKSFTITANSGYQLVDVLVDSVSVGAVLTYTFTNVQAEHVISAVFSINTYQIISTAGSGGTIVPLGTITVNQGSNQGYVITPNEDYIIQDIYIDGIVVELPASGTLFITD